MATSVTLADVHDAEDFLEQFLSAKIQDGDYTDGSMLRDMSIKAIAYVFAYLRKVDAQIRARQSLKSLEEVDTTDDEDAADDAADEILSNWFATRNRGTFARVNAYGHVSERVDLDIPADAVFYKSSSLPFLVDNNGESLQIAAEDLVAQFNSEGVVSDYVFRIPLVAQDTGSNYNISAGRFSTFDEFSAYVTYIETLESATGGNDIESTEDFIARSKNLVTVRNLINARSCDAVLRDAYPEIRTLTVVGMGDTEMVRDRVIERATGLELHVGGHQDIFIDQAITEQSFTGVVGARFARPDNVISIFRDPTEVTGTSPSTFPEMGVKAGMVLRVTAGLSVGIRDYIIREVQDTALIISRKIPFSEATDEQTPPGNVTWSVGNIQPDYDDIISEKTTGETSRQSQTVGRITLPGGPLYAIKEVTVNNPADPDADPADNLVHFDVRVNTTPTEQVSPDLEYQVVVHTPENHQSTRSYTELVVGPSGNANKYDGYTCQVVYETLSGFSSIHSFVTGTQQRIAGANPLIRAFHPVYLSFTVEYRLKRTATSTVDEVEAAEALRAFINAFSPTEVLDVSTLTDYFKDLYPDVGHVYPFLIDYEVHVPDGRVIEFQSSEAVVVPHNSSELANLLLYPGDAVNGLDDPAIYGLSDDVLRYLALQDAILVIARSN